MDFKKDMSFPPAATLMDINNIIDQMKNYTQNNIKNNTNVQGKIGDYINLVNIINSSLPNLLHNNIIIKPSPLHGKGVFATHHIPNESIVTFYPPHAIKINNIVSILCSDSPNIRDFESNFSTYKKDYSVYTSDLQNSMFIGNSHMISNSLLLGHIINDPVGNIFKGISFEKTKNYDIYRNLVENYFIKGLKMHNCQFVFDKNNIVICVETNKDIRKGEELLTCYGPSYWFNHTYGTNDSDDNHGITFLKKMFDDPQFQILMSNLDNFFI